MNHTKQQYQRKYIMKISLHDLIANPSLYNEDNFYGFYDWFANQSTLKRRMQLMMPKIKFLVKEGLVNGDTNYVWFKNNCPSTGGTYDDARISTLGEDNDFLGGFCFDNYGSSSEGGAQFWTLHDDCEPDMYYYDGWTYMKAALKHDEDLRSLVRETFNPDFGSLLKVSRETIEEQSE